MRVDILGLFLVGMLCLTPQVGFSASLPQFTSSYAVVVMPVMKSSSVIIDTDENPPTEPNLVSVTFLKLPSVNSLGDRVDRLVQGVQVSIPPEYDHYGYELRRYMAQVGNIKIYTDPEFVIEQQKNLKSARIIFNFWKKHLEQEVSEISDLMDDDQTVAFDVRTAFKRNKVTVKAFLFSLQSWIEANERLLSFMHDNPQIYALYYPELIITSSKLRIEFFNLLTARQVKLKDIKEYMPFSIMPY